MIIVDIKDQCKPMTTQDKRRTRLPTISLVCKLRNPNQDNGGALNKMKLVILIQHDDA